MTDEELDEARADEAERLYRQPGSAAAWPTLIAARLAREGWMPVDPDLIEARECAAQTFRVYNTYTDAAGIRKGSYGGAAPIRPHRHQAHEGAGRMTTQPPEGLSPCAHCGGSEINYLPGVFIGCMYVDCGVSVEMGSPWGGPEKDGIARLIAAWNRRTPTSKPPTGSERERVARIVELAIMRHGVSEYDLRNTLDDADAILSTRKEGQDNAILRDVVNKASALLLTAPGLSALEKRRCNALLTRVEAHIKESDG